MLTGFGCAFDQSNPSVAAQVNPFINYVTAPELVRPLSDYSRFLHTANASLKLYYTTSMLSNHVDILWVLRSLGAEIIDAPDPASVDYAFHDRGYAWLQEHLGHGYEPGWSNPNPPPIAQDASVCNIDLGAGQNHLRWENYYIAGLQHVMDNPPHIDGL